MRRDIDPEEVLDDELLENFPNLPEPKRLLPQEEDDTCPLCEGRRYIVTEKGAEDCPVCAD